MPLTVGKACIPCRDRKRKCDRCTPTCSLCHRLGRQCQYEGRVRSRDIPKTILGLPNINRTHLQNFQPLTSASFFDGSKLVQSNITIAVTENLSRVVGDLAGLRKVASKYFSSIHLWFPIVSDSSYYERLSNVFSKPSAEVSLLSLSFALITTIPPEDESWNSLSSLYMLVKSSIAVVEAANIHGLEVVQARLLVSLFEAGHDIEPAAYISIAATARAAAAIGLNQIQRDVIEVVPENPGNDEEGARVWWGIVMLDRNYSLKRGEGTNATQDLGSPRYLPKDGSFSDHNSPSSVEPLPLSTPKNVRIGPFARQAQVSHLLGILLLHLHEREKTGVYNKEESDQLARTFTAFSLLVPEEKSQPWPSYCGAIGMCYNGLMTLHESRPQEDTTPGVSCIDAPESLASTLSRLNYISSLFNARIAKVNFEAMSPFPPFSLAKASTIQYQLWRETGDIKCLTAAESLKTMIRHFSKRWMGAAKVYQRLEEERKAVSSLHSQSNQALSK